MNVLRRHTRGETIQALTNIHQKRLSIQVIFEGNMRSKLQSARLPIVLKNFFMSIGFKGHTSEGIFGKPSDEIFV